MTKTRRFSYQECVNGYLVDKNDHDCETYQAYILIKFHNTCFMYILGGYRQISNLLRKALGTIERFDAVQRYQNNSVISLSSN